MKLLITIVQDQDVQPLLEALMEHGFSATKLASTGGFLRVGNTTILIGVEDHRQEQLYKLIKQTCKRREQYDAPTMSPFGRGGVLPQPTKVSVGGAIVFVVDVERFEKI